MNSEKDDEFINPLPPVEEQEQFDSHTPEEVYQNLLELIEKEQDETAQWQSRLADILDAFERFLTETPEPPPEWMKRFGDRYEKFDYHQIVLPDDLCDPYDTEIENIRRIRNELEDQSYQSLEHYLIVRNHFVFTNGHAENIPAPKPILMLESEQRDEEITWDCTYTLFGDGSYQAYNLEKEEEESLGAFGQEVARLYPSVLRKLVLRLPVEGEDYGLLKPIRHD